jgi:hypothetical protein
MDNHAFVEDLRLAEEPKPPLMDQIMMTPMKDPVPSTDGPGPSNAVDEHDIASGSKNAPLAEPR